jgi:hypothetical protein
MNWVDDSKPPQDTNKREVMDLSGLTGKMLQKLERSIPRAQIPKLVTRMRLTVDGESVIATLPEADIFKKIKETISANKQKYQAMKTAYEVGLKQFQDQLTKLTANEYNCN